MYRLMGIGADQLGPPAGSSLLDLSDDTTLRRNNLEAAIDDLHNRLGTRCAAERAGFFQKGAT